MSLLTRSPLIAFLIALWIPGAALAISPNSTDAREIMAAVESRDTGDRLLSRLQITITDHAGRKRSRVVRVRGMEVAGGSKQIMLFESPADIRNAGLLSIQWDDPTKADDQWLYLPSLGRSTRISSSDRSGSFMGTDLTYSDMSDKDIEDYDYTLLSASATVGGEDCWHIEARPRNDKELQETGYIKTQLWISKSKLSPIQSKAWVKEGKRLKYSKWGKWKQISGIWVAHEVVVRTVRNGEVESTSSLVVSDVQIGAEGVSEADFTQGRLEQGL